MKKGLLFIILTSSEIAMAFLFYNYKDQSDWMLMMYSIWIWVSFLILPLISFLILFGLNNSRLDLMVNDFEYQDFLKQIYKESKNLLDTDKSIPVKINYLLNIILAVVLFYGEMYVLSLIVTMRVYPLKAMIKEQMEIFCNHLQRYFK